MIMGIGCTVSIWNLGVGWAYKSLFIDEMEVSKSSTQVPLFQFAAILSSISYAIAIDGHCQILLSVALKLASPFIREWDKEPHLTGTLDYRKRCKDCNTSNMAGETWWARWSAGCINFHTCQCIENPRSGLLDYRRLKSYSDFNLRRGLDSTVLANSLVDFGIPNQLWNPKSTWMFQPDVYREFRMIQYL